MLFFAFKDKIQQVREAQAKQRDISRAAQRHEKFAKANKR